MDTKKLTLDELLRHEERIIRIMTESLLRQLEEIEREKKKTASKK